MIRYFSNPIMLRLRKCFERLYGPSADLCLERLAMMVGRYGIGFDLSQPPTRWDQRNCVLIAYGDTLQAADEKPLVTLNRFADQRLRGAFSTIHILPFFPYSSDDGFSVIHFRTVNSELGAWENVQRLGKYFRLIFDLVLNHVSRQSGWFRDYEIGVAPGRNYFIEVDPSSDFSAVVRPRSSPLSTPVNTASGVRHVWTTFSADQVDLDYSNPDVLFEMLDILFYYVSMGARIIRLDAIAYVWKKIGTPCIHLPETHEIVKIFRAVLELVAPDVLLLTETNVPHEKNVSYFGNGDEAHLVYQFSLPPLVLHALLTGNARYLTQWAAALADPPSGCAFLNFTASHDGIGIRPLEGLLPESAVHELLKQVRQRGGRISTRRDSDGTETPYEMNITYFDALSFPKGGHRELHIARFLCSQTIALSLKGIPGVYFNSLIAANNDYVLAEQTGQARSLNRMKWDDSELTEKLKDPATEASRVFNEYVRLLKIRSRHASFHPDGEQRVLDFGESVFTVERIAPDKNERVLAIHNVSEAPVKIPAGRLKDRGLHPNTGTNLIAGQSEADRSGPDLPLRPYETVWLCFR